MENVGRDRDSRNNEVSADCADTGPSGCINDNAQGELCGYSGGQSAHDDMNSSQRKRTATNKSINNLDNLLIESNNSFKNKKIRSEREINNSDSKK